MKFKRLMAAGVAVSAAVALSMAYANPLCVTTDSSDSLWWILGCMFR